MNPEVHLVVQFTSVFRVYLKRPTSLPLQNGFWDLKSVFPSRENTSKGWSKGNVNGINNAPCRTRMTTLNECPSYLNFYCAIFTVCLPLSLRMLNKIFSRWQVHTKICFLQQVQGFLVNCHQLSTCKVSIKWFQDLDFYDCEAFNP